MISKMVNAEVEKTNEKPLNFGSVVSDETIAKIKIAIFERNVADYELNNLSGVKFDYIGLTSFSEIEKGMSILHNDKKYNVNYVQNSKRLKTVYLELVK